jgi:hypothetical protein
MQYAQPISSSLLLKPPTQTIMSVSRLMLFMKPVGLSESRGTYVYHCDVTGSRNREALCPATLFPEHLVAADGCSHERQPNVRTGRGPKCVSQLPKGTPASNLKCPHFTMIPPPQALMVPAFHYQASCETNGQIVPIFLNFCTFRHSSSRDGRRRHT